MRELSVAEQRYQAVLAVIKDGRTVTEAPRRSEPHPGSGPDGPGPRSRPAPPTTATAAALRPIRRLLARRRAHSLQCLGHCDPSCPPGRLSHLHRSRDRPTAPGVRESGSGSTQTGVRTWLVVGRAGRWVSARWSMTQMTWQL